MTRRPDRQLPRALLVTRNLPPLLGGMERLNLHMARELADAYRLTVIGPAGCADYLPSGVEVVEVPVRPLGVFVWRSLVAAWRAAADKPLFAIAGSGLTAPMVNLVAWRSKAMPVAYVHGLDLVARHPVYRLFWLPALRKLEHAFANSASTADIAVREGVAARNVTVLHPGVDAPEAAEGSRTGFRARHGLLGARILLSVGRMTPRKGLLEFVRYSLSPICLRHPDAVLVVVGDEAPDALGESGAGSVARLLEAAAGLGLRDRVVVLGVLADDALDQAYAAADVHVFPVRERPGDVEGFGMVALEAAAHGLATVAFAVGGVPDAVRPGHNGYLVAPGDYQGFAERVSEVLDSDDMQSASEAARAFSQGFHWDKFGARLRDALSSLAAGPPEPPGQRMAHAVLDLQSRAVKARKIEALLGLTEPRAGLRMLEIGTGSGGIAHYFGANPAIDVDAVDVADARQIRGGYRFTLVEGTRLPFPDCSFDVVITNHVVEHVGGVEAQRDHLSEVRRVMASDGVGYLAVPNRWMLVEPHYRLAFLSWLPKRWRSPYLHWRRGVPHYDCEPLTLAAAERVMRSAGLAFENLTVPALRMTLEMERPERSLLRRIVDALPDRFIAAMLGASPTLIYRLSRDGAGTKRACGGPA